MADEVTKQDILTTLQVDLALSQDRDVLALVNLEAIGAVEDGAETVAKAIAHAAGTVVMPAFTYQTQIIPQTGPPDNALVYGSGDDLNARATIFRPDLPVHPDCGTVAEALRQDPRTLRSVHPILSFVAQGDHARQVLGAQTQQNPLAPIAWLEAHDGAVLLMGVDHRQNYALHLAEQRAGRKTFVRWALTMDDIEELSNIPGCREGFNALWRELMHLTTVAHLGMARCELIPLKPLMAYAEKRLREEPNFMLCHKPSCLTCNARLVI